jgi:hypothetical protein
MNQKPVQQTPVYQVNNINGLTSAPFNQTNQTKQLNYQAILNRVTNNTNLNINETHTTIPLDDNNDNDDKDDKIISVSSIKPNARIEVTETLMSNSDTISSVNSSDLIMKQGIKKRVSVALDK